MSQNEKYAKEVDLYVRQLEALSGREVVVGIPASNNKNHVGKETIAMAELGAIHEYGAPSVGIPQRSFLRVPLSANVNNIFKVVEQDLKFKDTDSNKALNKLGAKGQTIVLEPFKTQGDGAWQPLSRKTILRRKKGKGKGEDKPLIDTGQLRRSITWEVRNAT